MLSKFGICFSAHTIRRYGRSVCVIASLLATTCSSQTTSTTPSAQVPDPVNVAGTWVGTLESSGLAPRSISLVVVQGGSCVDGGWKTDPAEWVGTISGFADATSYSGLMTIENLDRTCTGVATVSGLVGTDTLRWTGTGFTGGCPGGLPRGLTISLSRQ
ncbi:MAG: hypothetical protein ABMA15_03000 [Vicinamibacterales bacterium]